MNSKDAFASFHIGTRDDDAAIEAPGAQQRGIEDIGAVGRGDEDDALVGLEAIHLDQQLVQRLFAFVVPAAEACATMTSDRINLIDEDDAGRVLLALDEQIADARSTHANEHFNEIGTRYREERHARFARNRAREQRFAGSRRADQQDALGNTAAEASEALRDPSETG